MGGRCVYSAARGVWTSAVPHFGWGEWHGGGSQRAGSDRKRGGNGRSATLTGRFWAGLGKVLRCQTGWNRQRQALQGARWNPHQLCPPQWYDPLFRYGRSLGRRTGPRERKGGQRKVLTQQEKDLYKMTVQPVQCVCVYIGPYLLESWQNEGRPSVRLGLEVADRGGQFAGRSPGRTASVGPRTWSGDRLWTVLQVRCCRCSRDAAGRPTVVDGGVAVQHRRLHRLG